MTESLLMLAPVAIVVLVLLLAFAGCALDREGRLATDPLGPAPPYGPIITSTPNVVAYWRLGEAASAATAADELGAHAGTYTEVAPIGGIDLPFGASAAAPGTITRGAPGLIVSEPARTSVIPNGGYVEVPHNDNALDPVQFSVEAMVFPLWDPAERAFRSVVTSRDIDAGQPRGYALYATPLSGDSGNQYRWEAWAARGTGAGLDAYTRVAGGLVMFGATTHLTMTFDGTDLKLYQDGEIRAQQTVTGFVANATRPLRIGAGVTELDPPDHLFPFNGRIQEVAVYSRALTDQEVFARWSNNF